MSFKQLFSAKPTFFLLLILLAFLTNLKYQQGKNQRAVEKEKQELAGQISALENKNNELSRSLSYLNSEGFKERVVREELNLKKPGEAVYNFSEAKAAASADAGRQNRSNFQKWIRYFTSGN